MYKTTEKKYNAGADEIFYVYLILNIVVLYGFWCIKFNLGASSQDISDNISTYIFFFNLLPNLKINFYF